MTDARTHQPVQAAIHYYPFLSNDRAKDYRNFDPNLWSLFWTGTRYRTDADGRFRVVGLPGRGIVAAKTFDRSYRLGVGADTIPERPIQRGDREEGLPTYNHIHPIQFQVLAAIDPPVGVEEFHHDLVVEPSSSLTVQLVDPEGRPLTQVEAWGRFPMPTDPDDLNLREQSRTEIIGLDPKTARTVVFQHNGRKLGAVLVIKPEHAAKGDERTVTLRPCATVTGRVVDADGKPVSGGAEPHVIREVGEWPPEIVLLPISIDKNGRFRIDTLVPGARYTLHARDRLAYGLDARGRMEPQRFKPFELARNLKAEPGQVIDLGTFNAATGQRNKEPEKPTEAQGEPGKAANRTMPISGRIVDLEGRPVAGVSVQITADHETQGREPGPLDRGGQAGRTRHRLPTSDLRTAHHARGETSQGHDRCPGPFPLRGPGCGPARRTRDPRSDDRVHAGASRDAADGALGRTRVLRRITARVPKRSTGPRLPTPVRPDGRWKESCATPRPTSRWRTSRSGAIGSPGPSGAGIKDLKTTTDAQGRFRLLGFPKGAGNQLLVVPNDDQPYFLREVAVPDPPGIAPVPVEVALHKGIWIQGKVTDKETGKPVAGGWMHYIPFLDNAFAQATPEFGNDRNPDGSIYQDRYQTKADGTYRLVGLPGRAIVGVDLHSGKPYLQGAGAESIKGMDSNGKFPTYLNPLRRSNLPHLHEGDQSARWNGSRESRLRALSRREGSNPGR